jgi:hypothetical protein
MNTIIAYIDFSGSMTPKMIAAAISQAHNLNIKKAAYFNYEVSNIMDLDELQKLAPRPEGPTLIEFLRTLPEDITPHIFTDGCVQNAALLKGKTVTVIPLQY